MSAEASTLTSQSSALAQCSRPICEPHSTIVGKGQSPLLCQCRKTCDYVILLSEGEIKKNTILLLSFNLQLLLPTRHCRIFASFPYFSAETWPRCWILYFHPKDPASRTALTSQAASCAVEARKLLHLRALQSQECQCARCAQFHRSVTYSPDDLVHVCTAQHQVGLSQKLLPRCRGPYIILTRASEATYLVEQVGSHHDGRQKDVDAVRVVRFKPHVHPSPSSIA